MVSVIGILVAVAVPNFYIFQCRGVGLGLKLDESSVTQLCEEFDYNSGLSPEEALEKIRSGQATFEEFIVGPKYDY